MYCCFRRLGPKKPLKALEPVVSPPTPPVAKSEVCLATNSVLPPPPPPPVISSPPRDDPSPPFTVDEAFRIAESINNLQGILDTVYATNGNVIIEVQNMLTIQPPPDPSVGPWTDIFETALGVISAVSEPYLGPSAEVVAALLGGAVEHVTNDKEAQEVTNIDLNDSKGFGLMSSRLTNTYNAQGLYLAEIARNPNDYRDKEFSIPEERYPPLKGKTFTIRQLLTVPIPKNDSVPGKKFILAETNAFRGAVTKCEMPKKQWWWVAFVQDKIWKGSNFGNAYHPTGTYNPSPRTSGAPGGTLSTRKMNDNDLGKDVGIFANDEILHHHPDYTYVKSVGQNVCHSQDDYINNFMLAIKDFTSKFPAAHIGPYTIDKDNNEIRYYKWFLLNGPCIQDGTESGAINHKICNPPPGAENFALATGEFVNWLYIDDGAGNIVNSDGCGYRDDVLRHWTSNGFQIPPTTAGF